VTKRQEGWNGLALVLRCVVGACCGAMATCLWEQSVACKAAAAPLANRPDGVRISARGIYFGVAYVGVAQGGHVGEYASSFGSCGLPLIYTASAIISKVARVVEPREVPYGWGRGDTYIRPHAKRQRPPAQHPACRVAARAMEADGDAARESSAMAARDALRSLHTICFMSQGPCPVLACMSICISMHRCVA